MKRNIIILGIIVVLAAVAIVLVTRRSSSTIKRELRDFAVEDTASIDRIFMVRKDNQQVTLTREGNRWMVNGKFEARPDAIENLLKTLNRLKIKSPISASAMDNAVRMLATRNTKVEAYHGKKLLKTIYVGGPTQDQMGTFMMLEGSSVPFIVHIPGFTGYLSSRFFIDEVAWKSTAIFRYNFNDIKTVLMENPADAAKSFRLSNEGNDHYVLSTPGGSPIPGMLDTASVKFYLSQFEKLSFEFYADSLSPRVRDSLLATRPHRIITLEDRSGKVRKVTAWKRPSFGKPDSNGNPQEFDDERLWALIDRDTWVVIQYYVFNSLWANQAAFFKSGG